MTTILFDSDGLIALSKADDVNHKKAIELLGKISDEKLIIPNTTLAEAVTSLGRKVGKKESFLLLDYLRNEKFSPFTVDGELFSLAENFYRKQSSRKNTFFDCINMAVAQTLSAEFIFSFDKSYVQNGFKLLES